MLTPSCGKLSFFDADVTQLVFQGADIPFRQALGAGLQDSAHNLPAPSFGRPSTKVIVSGLAMGPIS